METSDNIVAVSNLVKPRRLVAGSFRRFKMLTFLRKKMKVILIIVAVVFVASMFYGVVASRGQSGGGRTRSDVLAKVDGKNVDPHRYREMVGRIIRQFGANIQPQDMAYVQNLALSQTIDFMVILKQANKQVKVSNREVDMAIDNVMEQQGVESKKQLEMTLKRLGSSLGKFKSMIKEEMMVQKMINKVRSDIQLTSDDLREVKASHILVTTEAGAKDVYARVKKGEDFAKLAKKYSQDTGSAMKGGDLGYFATGSMVEPFEKAAFSQQVGEISQPVKSRFGYHIIKVTDSRLRKFGDKTGADIEQAALAEKQDKVFRQWYTSLRDKTKVEIVNPALRANDLRFKGRIWESISEYKKAIVQDPGNAYLHIFLGDVYNTIGKEDLAIKEYETAASIEGGNPLLYIILAQAYEKAGQKNQAVKQYKKASIVSGDNKEFHEQLLEKFKELKAWPEYEREKKELARIAKKEKFELELTGEK